MYDLVLSYVLVFLLGVGVGCTWMHIAHNRRLRETP